MKKVEKVCKIKSPVKGEFWLWEKTNGLCVCTYKYNRVGAWGWTLARSKQYCLLLTRSPITFSFYAWA